MITVITERIRMYNNGTVSAPDATTRDTAGARASAHTGSPDYTLNYTGLGRRTATQVATRAGSIFLFVRATTWAATLTKSPAVGQTNSRLLISRSFLLSPADFPAGTYIYVSSLVDFLVVGILVDRRRRRRHRERGPRALRLDVLERGHHA